MQLHRKRATPRLLWPILWALFLPLAACQTGQNSDTVSVEVSPSSTLLWEIGSSASLKAVAKNNSGPVSQQPAFTWESSNPDVATVDDAGNVTAIAEGEAVISAVALGSTGEAKIVVNTSTVTLSGQVRYQDKEYSPVGFNQSKILFKPARYVLVDLLDTNGNVFQTVATDAQGNFTTTPLVPASVTVRVLAKTDAASGIDIEVNDMSGNLYAVSQSIAPEAIDAGMALDIGLDNGAAGAFNMLDVFTNGEQFVDSLAGTYPPSLRAFWQTGYAQGTYFCSVADPSYCKQGVGIYVSNNGSQGDTDEYDDDVLWHEFGHFVANHFSRDDSQGGCHLLSSNDLDLRLAWSEGWGDFFPSAVKSWLASDAQTMARLSTASGMAPTYYVDTYGTSALISIDIASPASAYSSDPYVYASSEMAIAKILWRLTQDFGMASIWNVTQSYLPTTVTPVSLETFYDGWLSVNAPDYTAWTTVQSIFGDRQVFYRADSFESDDTVSVSRSATLGTEETHYLYKQGGVDKDVVNFDATAGTHYVIETYGLTNGADTYLSLRDATGNELANNDDQNNNYYAYDSMCGDYRYRNTSLALSSKIDFTASTSGTYTVEVSTTPDPEPYPSAGRYGTYKLKISAL